MTNWIRQVEVIQKKDEQTRGGVGDSQKGKSRYQTSRND